MKKSNIIALLAGIFILITISTLYLFMTKKNNGEDSKVDVIFRIHAPEAKTVFVSGSFNSWNIVEYLLEKQDSGMWETTIGLAPGRYEYKFMVDSQWVWDANNPVKVPVPPPYGGYNSVIDIGGGENDSTIMKYSGAVTADSLGKAMLR